MNKLLRYLGVLVSLSAMMACARLPEYAQPRTIKIDEIPRDRPVGFTYRQLTMKDFRASSLPENLLAHLENINAYSAIQIRPTAGSKVIINRWPEFDQENYFGAIGHLAFEAVMFPEKSWWNPRTKTEMTDYVLQHEQIHFALTELAARRLTKDVQKWAVNLKVIKPTPQLVVADIMQQIKELINSAMESNLKRHTAFDEDTSLYHNPKWQSWWTDTVERELKQN